MALPKQDDFFIIHASDLHHHPTQAYDATDRKVDLAIRKPQIDEFWGSLRLLSRAPDMLVFSGDLSLRGNEGGHDEFARRIHDFRKERKWSDLSKVVVAPGNHDVRWEIERGFDQGERYASFARATQGARRPNLPGASAVSEPYSLDIERKVLVYALDSARHCGVRETDSDDWKQVDAILATIPDHADRAKAAGWAAERRLHDVAYVDRQQLEDMIETAERVSPGPDWIRIAVLHHHLVPLAGGVPTEIKTFETVINAGAVLDALHRAGFSMVLHGHKHVPRVQFHFDHQRGTKLAVLCAPTAGGEPVQSGNGYYGILITREESGVAVSVETRHHDSRPSSTETVLLDLPGTLNWQAVHVRWQQEKIYGQLLRSRVIERMNEGTAEDIDRLCHAATTRPLGNFPDFFRHVPSFVTSAKKTLHVACDFPGYAILSSPDVFDSYHNAILDCRQRPNVMIKLRYLGPDGQKELHDFLAPSHHASNIEDGGVPLGRLNALNERLRKLGKGALKRGSTIAEYQECTRMVHAAVDKELREAEPRIEVAYLRLAPPIYVWIADRERAIFAIPGGADRVSIWTNEIAYETEDRFLVERLMMIWRFYDAYYVRRDAPVTKTRKAQLRGVRRTRRG